MKTKDLSPRSGRRYRIRVDEYHRPPKRQFAPVKGYASAFNLTNQKQLAQLWNEVNATIARFLERLDAPQAEEVTHAAGSDGAGDSARP